jgi:hypothetical protein
MQDNLKPAMLKLLSYCRADAKAGYDPYDALNSRLFSGFPFCVQVTTRRNPDFRNPATNLD